MEHGSVSETLRLARSEADPAYKLGPPRLTWPGSHPRARLVLSHTLPRTYSKAAR